MYIFIYILYIYIHTSCTHSYIYIYVYAVFSFDVNHHQAFEWGTGAEESQRQKQRSDKATLPPPPVVLDPTNINLCLFQQFSLFEDWWCQVEALHKCGFTARILMSPTQRAIIDPALGLQDSACVGDVMQRIWVYVASHYGPQHAEPDQQLRPSLAAQEGIRAFYYDLHGLCHEIGAWQDGIPYSKRSLLVFSCSCRLGFKFGPATLGWQFYQSFLPAFCFACLPDLRHSRFHRLPYAASPERFAKSPIGSSQCPPYGSAGAGDLFEKSNSGIARELALFCFLGEVKEARRRHGGQTRCVEFHRFDLNAAVSAALSELGVSQVLWPSVSPSLPPIWLVQESLLKAQHYIIGPPQACKGLARVQWSVQQPICLSRGKKGLRHHCVPPAGVCLCGRNNKTMSISHHCRGQHRQKNASSCHCRLPSQRPCGSWMYLKHCGQPSPALPLCHTWLALANAEGQLVLVRVKM